MPVITRYFTKEFLKTLALCLSSFVALYLLVDLFERLDDIVEHKASFSQVVKYCLYQIPMIVYQVLPLGILLCTFITLGIFVKNNEITAIKAHGISLFSVLKTFVFISSLFCVFSLFLQEFVLPHTNWQVKKIKNIHIKGKKEATYLKKEDFWFRSKNRICKIGYFDPGKNRLYNITLFYFDPEFRVEKKIEAESAVWTKDHWVFNNGAERSFKKTGEMKTKKFKSREIAIDKVPEDFMSFRKESEEMSFTEIRAFINKTKQEGYPTVSFEADMHAKISYSFICIIMAVLGIPFSLMIGRSGGMALGIAISLALGFVYWTFFAFCLSLGKGGELAPFVSAWSANLAFGFLGLYLFLHVRQ